MSKQNQLKNSAIAKFLEDRGWTKYRSITKSSSCQSFWKKFLVSTKCKCNDENFQIIVCCHTYDYESYAIDNGQMNENFTVKYEFELSGQFTDGTWIKLTQYANPEKIEDGIKLIPRMLGAWDFMASRS
jgi:hypothetical protein